MPVYLPCRFLNVHTRDGFLERIFMESNSQLSSQPTPNQGYPPSTLGYPQIPSQPTPNQRQYPLSYQGYPPSAQGYQQMPPKQPYQQVSPQPNQGFVPSLQRARLWHALRRSRGLALMLLGGILIVGGIVLSVISYSFASSAAGNGYYTIFTGPIVIGIICTIFGFFRWIMGR
jgi:hypothetical protein